MASLFTLVSKIGAYKSFSEILPLKFANFTCNQALLEAMGGYDLIHIIDFEIGYGGQHAGTGLRKWGRTLPYNHSVFLHFGP